jgi:hypothetical protein
MREIKIWYSSPYSTAKNIGKALNEFCELIPDDDWICLQDGDIMFLTPDWGNQIEETVKRYGNKFQLIGCMTNRLGRNIQKVDGMFDEKDITKHYLKAKELSETHYAEVEVITKKRFVAGMFMLFPKSVWQKHKFKENVINFDDCFSRDIVQSGGKLGLMKGLYVFHLYRIWSESPKTERTHLK